MDLKDALEFITDLKEQADKPKVLEIDGKTYINRNLTRYYKNDYPAALETYTLTSMVDYIKDLSDEIAAGRLVVHIESEKEVTLTTELNSEGKRCKLMQTSPKVPRPEINRWMDQESFIIMLQACFMDSDDRSVLLKVAGNVESKTVKSYGDDGVTQQATIKSGIASLTDVIVPGRVKLTPYRTFLEIDQPSSEYVFRIRDGETPEFKLIEADGGAWKICALTELSSYFCEELKEEIKKGEVIVIA